MSVIMRIAAMKGLQDFVTWTLTKLKYIKNKSENDTKLEFNKEYKTRLKEIYELSYEVVKQ